MTAPATDQISLYEKWRKIYPLWLKGGFQTWRRVVLLVLVGVYLIGPWLQWNGHPLFWFNLPARQFTFLGSTFWPQEFVLLSWILMIAAFALFLATVMAGRVWCGWACPQTIWTLVYFWIEKVVEGSRTQRLRLDGGSWNGRRVTRKLLKWSLWALVALSISFTFVAYFTRPLPLLNQIATLSLTQWEIIWLAIPAGASFLFSGVLREQVCFHMCPYARFQSVMFDHDTLIISYNDERGEPRGHRARKQKPEPEAPALGDCVDCMRCVHACPTGIDIRDGLQYQCIACAACIDACNDVMAELDQAPNLIRYSSQTRDQGETRRWLRPRLIGYAVMLLSVGVGFGWNVSHRIPLELDIIRERAGLYREHWDGTIENSYTLHVLNREAEARRYEVSVDASFPLELTIRGGTPVEVQPGEQRVFNARITAQADPNEPSNRPVLFAVESVGEPNFRVQEVSRFLQPEEASK